MCHLPSVEVYHGQVHMLEDMPFDSEGGTQPTTQGQIQQHQPRMLLRIYVLVFILNWTHKQE